MNEKKAVNGKSGNGAIIDAETVSNLENLDAEAAAEELDAELIDAVKSDKKEEKKEDESIAKTAMIIGIVEAILKAKWPFLNIDDGVRSEIFGKAHPVFNKYGEGFPLWLAPWKEEVELGIVLSVAGYGIHSQISAHSEKHNSNQSDNQREPTQSTTATATGNGSLQ